MAQGVAAGGVSGTTAGAGANTAVDDDPGTAEGGHATAMENSSVSSAAGASHGDVAGADHGDAAGVDVCLGPVAMDPNSSYVLKIRLLGNPKKARKDIKCFYFEKVVDPDLTNYEDLLESIIVQYQPCYLEVVHVHYYDEVLKTFPEIKSDQELMHVFEKQAKAKMVQMFIVYWNPSEPYEPITQYYSYCKRRDEDNCPCRIHASTTDDLCTIVVIV
ncbi:hypothetical protein ZWY2020_029323 [Hordeum vulgare]|nr:hypothetical protein ZWY2020_029323 [Hordeum vulgare]